MILRHAILWRYFHVLHLFESYGEMSKMNEMNEAAAKEFLWGGLLAWITIYYLHMNEFV
jgi:hypothetical protein